MQGVQQSRTNAREVVGELIQIAHRMHDILFTLFFPVNKLAQLSFKKLWIRVNQLRCRCNVFIVGELGGIRKKKKGGLISETRKCLLKG